MYPMSEGEYRTGLRTLRLTELQIRSSTAEVRNGALKSIRSFLENRMLDIIETVVISMSSDATSKPKLMLDFINDNKQETIPN